jgi:class 3 adenylate cyclase
MSVAIPIRTNEPGTRYFTPRFANIVVGQTVTWYNAGNDIHSLIFDTELPPYDIKIGDIAPISAFSKKFEFYVPRIDYSCATHPEEKGTIVIYEKNEDEMTDTERLRHLQGFLGTKPPDVLSHLSHEPIIYGKKVSPDIAKYVSLEKFLDPRIYRILGDPELYQLQSKNMTIVFWDISSFSILCNILDKQPILITGFLRDYSDMAIKCIHDHRGIVDKLNGDGILSFFGFNNEDQKSGAHDAIMAALELRENFENIKRKWIEIWSKDFGHKKISLDVKCGINTGAVLFGLLDTDTRSQVTILGSPVNLASRLESVAENDQIIISPYVKDLIQNEFKLLKFVPKDSIRSYPDIDVVYEVTG